uniref:RdRp n=1 Tax=viral metagenome TaxID=1070528 RepID=A0A2V0RCC9_9ZZZZ
MKEYLSTAERIATQAKFKPWRFTKLDSEGVPEFLWDYLTLLQGTSSEKQIALTILSLGRLYECDVSTYDTSSVTKSPPISYNGDHRPGSYFNQCYIDSNQIDLDKFNLSWKFVLNSLFPSSERDERIAEVSALNSLHITGRNGPNGHSLGCAYRDMIALVTDKKFGGDVISRIHHLAELTDNIILLSHLEDFPEDETFQQVMDEEISSGKTANHSKLNLKQGEPWWKERIFASGDFFTQSSLSGIQSWMARLLIKNKWAFDGSFNQSAALLISKEWTRHTYPYSKDLTTATDLIPIDLLGELCVQLFGLEIGNAWLEVMRDRDFYDPINDDYLSYNTGNPMGFYTSWYLLHYFQIIMYLTIEKYLNLSSSLELELPRFVIVGDDSSTDNSEISRIYDIIMTQLLEIPQSTFKGYSPDKSEEEHSKVCEMCKRIFVNGKDISPISPRVILDGICDPSTFPNMHLHINERVEDYTIMTTSEKLVPISHHPLRSLKMLANPILCSESELEDLGAIRYNLPVLDEYVQFISTISSDTFYASFSERVIREVIYSKTTAYQWVARSTLIFLPPEFGGEALTGQLTYESQIEPQMALLEDVLGNLLVMLIDSDQAMFTQGYATTLLNADIPAQSKILWKGIKNLIVLDNLPSYMGFGRVDRDEKGKAFGKKFENLLTDALTQMQSTDVDPCLDSELTFRKLQFVLSLSVLLCSPETQEEKLKDLAMIDNISDIPLIQIE